MAKGLSSEANSGSASQEIPRIFMEVENSLPLSQQITTALFPEPDQSTPRPSR
jgi:hypothetical protein